MKLLLDTHTFLWWVTDDARVYALPMHHRDPFDRMLIAQSQLEELPIITADPQISNYAVNVIW